MCVSFRSDAQSKSGKKEQTQGHMKKKIIDTQRKIKQTHKDISEYVHIIC